MCTQLNVIQSCDLEKPSTLIFPPLSLLLNFCPCSLHNHLDASFPASYVAYATTHYRAIYGISKRLELVRSGSDNYYSIRCQLGLARFWLHPVHERFGTR
jgi:hypothetical protein